MKDRRINLQGVGNARQLGGLSNGAFRIRENCLIRSAHLYRMTDDDIAILKDDYRLCKVVDLRRAEEVSERPDRQSDAFEYVNIPVIEKILAGITHDSKSRQKTHFDANDLLVFYRFIVLDEKCQKNLADVINTIIRHDYDKGSILWHCSEGKDRCGMISAFIMFMLGFDYDLILEDYLLTNETNEAKTERIYRMLIEEGRSHEDALVISELYLAKKSYFDSAYDAIIEKYKSIDAFFINALKLDMNDIELFRKRVLENEG